MFNLKGEVLCIRVGRGLERNTVARLEGTLPEELELFGVHED